MSFDQLQKSARKDHDGGLHRLQLAKEPRVRGDEDVLYETTLGLSGRGYIWHLCRLATAPHLEGLASYSRRCEDRVAPDVQDVVVEELEDHGQDGHGADHPDEAGGVVPKVAVLHDGGGESDGEENDELGVVEDVEGDLADERGDVKARRVCICLQSFICLTVSVLIVDPII